MSNITSETPKKTKLSKESYKKAMRIFSFIKPYKWLFSLGFVFLILSSVTTMAFPYLLGKLFGTNSAEAIDPNQLLNLDNANTILLLLFIIFVANAFFSFFRIYLFTSVTENVLKDIRKDAFRKMSFSKISFFDANKVGELSSRIATDSNSLQELLTTTLAEFIRQWITIGISIGVIAFLSPKLMGIMLAIVPLMIVVVIIFGKKVRTLSKNAQNAAADSNIILNETLTSIKSVKAYTNEYYELQKYTTKIEAIKTLSMKGAIWRGLFASFIIIGLFGATTVVIWQGILMVQSGEMNAADLITFLLFTGMLAISFGGVGTMMGSIQKAIGATERLLDLMSNENEIITETPLKEIAIEGSIKFDNIGFVYETRPDVTVLKHLSFTIEAGKTLAIVGHSGAGKSTIASLLFRFYDPTDGAILFDNKNINQYDLATIRNALAIVPQEVQLFAGTIKENIAYGDPKASEEAIKNAAIQANAMEFIANFPEGLNTLVGDRGIQLSGGQKQRIAIARAVLKNPTILVLDEATSSLDSESEKLVQDALFNIMQNRTAVVIAHRLSTIKNADKIIVIEKGTVVEEGNHESLMLLNNYYAKMIHLQH